MYKLGKVEVSKVLSYAVHLYCYDQYLRHRFRFCQCIKLFFKISPFRKTDLLQFVAIYVVCCLEQLCFMYCSAGTSEELSPTKETVHGSSSPFWGLGPNFPSVMDERGLDFDPLSFKSSNMRGSLGMYFICNSLKHQFRSIFLP